MKVMKVMNRLGIVYRPADELVPYARNARTHSAAQIDLLVESLRQFGWTNPVLTDAGQGVIAGHGRLVAAQRMWAAGERIAGTDTGMVPTIELTHLDALQRRAYVLADNQLAQRAGWDEALLSLELGELQTLGFALAPIGFEPVQLEALLGTGSGRCDPDAAPDAPVTPRSRRGDSWQLGAHRLICGDATDARDVQTALAACDDDPGGPCLMVTDPPYGVNYEPRWRTAIARHRSSQHALGRVKNDDQADWRDAWALFPGDVAYVWHADRHAHTVAASLIASGFDLRAQLIWRKQHFVLSRGDYHWQHEPCWYAVREGRPHHWQGSRTASTVWDIANLHTIGGPGGERDCGGPGNPARDARTPHSTQKPVECMKRPIEHSSAPGETIYDPFCGSGTTLIAAEITHRRCIAIELDPVYVDLAITRWQQFTGEAACHAVTGRRFDDLPAGRPHALSTSRE